MSSSVVTETPVDAPDLTGLIELSRDPLLDLKPIVLRVQTDLFLAAPIRDRAALEAFESLATGLIPTVDDETALTVARKLCACPDTPQAVLACLAARGGAIGTAVIVHAVRLGPETIEAAKAAGCDLAALLAERTHAADEGAEAGDDAQALTQAERDRAADHGARLGGALLARLLTHARREPDLASLLLARGDIPARELAPLWLHAGPEQRATILEALAATAALRPCPPAAQDIGPALTGFSAGGNLAQFVTTLAEALGLPKDFLAVTPDPSARYDLLTLALRAADLREPEAIFIFLTLNEVVARSVERVFALTELFRAASRPAARDLLSAVLDTPLPEPQAGAGHTPYHAPDTARPRSGAAPERANLRPALPQRSRRTV